MQSWMVGILLALTAFPAGAATFEVSARGRDDAVAQTNAGVNAVRACMKSMVSGEFLKANAETVRKGVILRSGDFVRSVTVQGRSEDKGLVVLDAVVDVDEKALAGVLSAMKMDEASETRMAGALSAMAEASAAAQAAAPAPEGAGDEGAAVAEAPAQAVAEAPASGAPGAAAQDAQALPFSGGSDAGNPAVPGAGDGASAQAPSSAVSAEDDREYVRGDNFSGADLYIEDMRTLSSLVSPRLFAMLLDEEERAAVNTLFSLNMRHIRIRVDDKYMTVLAEPPAAADLTSLTRPGMKVREVAGLLGLSESHFTPEMQSFLERDLQATSIPEVQKAGGLYVTSVSSFIIIGDHLPNVAEVRAMILEDTLPFTVQGEDPLRVCTRDIMSVPKEERKAPVQMVFGARPVEGGWLVRGSSTMGEIIPALREATPMKFSDMLLDRETPFFLLGFRNGNHVKALMSDIAEQDESVSGPMSRVTEALLSLGGGHVEADARTFPAVSLALRGRPEDLNNLVAMAEDGAPWKQVPVEGWDAVRVQPLDQILGMPLLSVMAQRKDTLVSGIMDMDALNSTQDARAVLSSSLRGTGVKMPEEVSSVMFLNVQQMFGELNSLLSDPMIGAMADMFAPGWRAPLQKLFSTTSPIVSVTGWSSCPDILDSTFFIAVTKENTDAFYAAVKELSMLSSSMK